MVLTNDLLNKLFNTKLIKSIYPMVDHIDAEVKDDGDKINPFYEMDIKIHLNDGSINSDNMYRKKFDPHYLVDIHLIDLLKFLDVSRRDITQIYISVFGPDGELIYPENN